MTGDPLAVRAGLGPLVPHWHRRRLLQTAAAWPAWQASALGAIAGLAPDLAVRDWAPLDAAVRGQIAAGLLPGAVILIGDVHRVSLRRAWGFRALEPAAEPMTIDTVFDFASLTKVVATTTAVLQLAERGAVLLDAPAARYWPAFAGNGKAAITLRHLLSHTSGLQPDLDLHGGWTGRGDALRRAAAETPRTPPGTRLLYSDINFIVLGELVRRVAGMPLDHYVGRHVAGPLRMRDTAYLPRPGLVSRIAPTEFADGRWLRGTVHDPTARRMGGVAGHAGLFGTADDLARFAQSLLRALAGGPGEVLSPASVEAMGRPQSPPGQSPWHGLGWQLQAPLVAARERLPPLGSIAHTGYTGTALWIDGVQRRFVILLSNRLHPDGRGNVQPLRRQVVALVSGTAAPLTAADLVAHDARFADHLTPPPAEPPRAAVATGIDRLVAGQFAPLRGRRIGLITHRAAIDAAGWRTIDRLRWADATTLVKIFSPEHGLYADAEGRQDAGIEPLGGLPLLSLYGDLRRPTPEQLRDIDTLVFDLQDAGARFFTYSSTLGLAMQAAAEAGLRFIVLDRPNPIRADRVGGPMLDAGRESFTGYMSLPVQHGMTIGELARLFADEIRRLHGMAVDLEVIAMAGYRRSWWFDQTGLDWVPPSPNLRTLTAAALYPGVAWVEGANLSVGRGTGRPFEWLGAPWIESPRWLDAVNALALPGLGFEDADFRPASGPYRGERCRGLRIRLLDRDRIDAPRLGLALVQSLFQLWPTRFQLDRTLALIGSADVLQGLRDGLSFEALAARWQAPLADFLVRRQPFLLY